MSTTTAPAATTAAAAAGAGAGDAAAGVAVDAWAGLAEDPTVADSAAELAELTDAVAGAERLLARAVLLAARVVRSGVCERLEGMPLELWLANTCRLIGADRHTLVTASEVCEHMPVLAGLFATGQVSWGQVRNIALAARRLSRGERADVDERIRATLERWGGLDGFPPDELLAVVDRAVDETLEARAVRRREQRRAAASYLALQPRFDGGSRFWGEADAVETAIMANAIHDAADPPTANGDGDGDLGDRDGLPQVSGRPRQLLHGLVRLAEAWLGGARPGPAKPSVVVHVDLDDITSSAAGLLETRLAGPVPTVSAALTEILARDADIRAVVFDGARPLAVSRKLHADDIPAATRRAVTARDRADRFPGSTLPGDDIHHLRHREHGGDHHPDNLAYLAASSHDLVHHHHWHTRLDPRTGVLTATRNRRTYRSLPRGTPLERPPPSSDPP